MRREEKKKKEGRTKQKRGARRGAKTRGEEMIKMTRGEELSGEGVEVKGESYRCERQRGEANR